MEPLNLNLTVVGYPNDHAVTKLKRRRLDVSPTPTSSVDGAHQRRLISLLQERHTMIMSQTDPTAARTVGGLHLIHLLLVSAANLIIENNITSAIDNLIELYKHASPTGDSGQRVAAYFAHGLTARILNREESSPFFCPPIMDDPNPAEELSAFAHFYRVSPFYQFAHFTANQAILEAFEREKEYNNYGLRVVDFDVLHGFQWPSLIQSLSERATCLNNNRTVSLRITGFGRTLEELMETEARLVSFSKSFHNIIFEFQGFLRGGSNLMRNNLIRLRENNETFVVNLVFHLGTMKDILEISDTLTCVNALNPSIVVLVEREGSTNQSSSSSSCGFFTSYVDALHYYAAMFDSLHDCLPRESLERLSIEKNHLGKEIRETLLEGCGDMNEIARCLRFEMWESWKARMERNRFSGIKLSSRVNMQAKLLLKMGSHCYNRTHLEEDCGGGGFRVCERDGGMAISLAWQRRFLATASVWRSL